MAPVRARGQVSIAIDGSSTAVRRSTGSTAIVGIRRGREGRRHEGMSARAVGVTGTATGSVGTVSSTGASSGSVSRQVTAVGEVGASSSTGRAGRREITLGALGVDPGEHRAGLSVAVHLARGTGGASVASGGSALRVVVGVLALGGDSGASSAGTGSAARLGTLGSRWVGRVGRSVGVNKAAALAVRARAGKPEGLDRQIERDGKKICKNLSVLVRSSLRKEEKMLG